MKTAKMLAILVFALGLTGELANADFIFGESINLGPTVNSSTGDNVPYISADGLALYFHSTRPGGYGDKDLWVTARPTTNDIWTEPVNLGPTVNSSTSDTAPGISADGLALYFGSTRPGGYGKGDIWVTTRPTINDPWGEPVNLGPMVNSSDGDGRPCISPDGLSLYFHSDCPGGFGYSDLYVTTRVTVEDEWGPPANLGPTVNAPNNDITPRISADGRLLFFVSNDRAGGFGLTDIWVTRRETINDDWGTPVNLGPTVNSSAKEPGLSISTDGRTIYFYSNQPGGVGAFDIWQAPIIPIVDLNSDGVVNAADMCIIVDHWGTDEPLCDIGLMPWGDGIVDVQDLIILAEHLFEDYRLIGHWKLDETEGDIAYDSAGNNHGTLNGDPQWVSGFIDGALEFDGQADYVAIGDFDLTGSFTLTCWIRPSSLSGGWHSVVIKEDDYGFEFDGSNLWGGVWGSGTDSSVSTTISTPTIWYHAALTWNGSDVEMFIDASSVGQKMGTHVSNNNPLLFGSWDTSSSFFNGIIDDVRIYNVALSAEEIEALVQ